MHVDEETARALLHVFPSPIVACGFFNMGQRSDKKERRGSRWGGEAARRRSCLGAARSGDFMASTLCFVASSCDDRGTTRGGGGKVRGGCDTEEVVTRVASSSGFMASSSDDRGATRGGGGHGEEERRRGTAEEAMPGGCRIWLQWWRRAMGCHRDEPA